MSDWDDYGHGGYGGGYGGYGGYGGGYGNRGGHSSHDKTDAQKKYEDAKAESLRSLKSMDFETDDKGQTTFLGMPISKDMKPVVEMAMDSVKPFIIDQSDKVAKFAASTAKRIGFTKSHATVGLVAENIFRWGIVGTKQIFDTVRASNKYSQERRELFATFSPVMQATGANLQNNEVIKVAYDEIHANWVSDMKKMAADLPALIPTAVFAWEDQVASAKKRKNTITHDNDPAATIAAISARNEQRTKDMLEQSKQTNEMLSTARAKIQSSYSGTELEEQLRIFENDTAYEIKKAQAERWKQRDHSEHEELEGKGKNTDKMLMGIIPITALVSQSLKSNIEEQAEMRRKRVKAWKMIEHLKVEMESHCGDKRGKSKDYDDCNHEFSTKSPEDITISGMGNRDNDTLNLKEYIVEVFQQHERDREPRRNFYDKQTGKAIDPLKGTMLTNLMPAVDIIAEHIADGTLSGDALYKLVGENKVIQHSASGARIFAKEDQIRKVIEDELTPVLGTREVVKLEEFMAKFADPLLIQNTLKKNLESMQGVEKSLFASLFPDDILVQAGMKKNEIFAARKQAHEHAYDFVAATAMHLSKKSEEELKTLGVTQQESSAINALAEKVGSGDLKAIKIAVDGRDKEIIDAVRTAGLLEQVKGGEKGAGFWTERVKEMGATHAAIKKSSEENKQESGEARKGEGEERDGDWSKRSSKKYRADSGHNHRGGKEDDSWAGDKSDSGFSDRFDAPKKGFGARDRVAKGRDAARDEAPDYRAV